MESVDRKLDTKLSWAKSPEEQSFDLNSLENNMLKDPQDKW